MDKDITLLNLPTEILQNIFKQVPNELKQTCRAFVVMYNDYYMNLFIERFGPFIFQTIARHDYKHLIDYVKSFDYWRKDVRMIVANNYNLVMPLSPDELDDSLSPSEILNCQFIRDSWKLIYGIYMNRRIFVDYNDYSVNNNENVFSHSIKIDRCLKLVPGLYNLSCGLIIKNSTGMSSTVFKILESKTGEKLLEYQPASNFGELVPHEKFVLLDMGSFEVKAPRIVEHFDAYDDNINQKDYKNLDEYDEDVAADKLVDIKLVVEEIGVLVKSGFVLCYIDINAYQLKDCMLDYNGDLKCQNQKYWLAWWIENQIPKPENVVNVLLKRLYKSIERSMFLIRKENPHRRMGSFAQSEIERCLRKTNLHNGEASVICEEEQEQEGENDDEEIEIEAYNQKFYSKLNADGELLKRCFKFRTQMDRRRYEAYMENRGFVDPGPLFTEPLKWKMATILEI